MDDVIEEAPCDQVGVYHVPGAHVSLRLKTRCRQENKARWNKLPLVLPSVAVQEAKAEQLQSFSGRYSAFLQVASTELSVSYVAGWLGCNFSLR